MHYRGGGDPAVQGGGDPPIMHYNWLLVLCYNSTKDSRNEHTPMCLVLVYSTVLTNT